MSGYIAHDRKKDLPQPLEFCHFSGKMKCVALCLDLEEKNEIPKNDSKNLKREDLKIIAIAFNMTIMGQESMPYWFKYSRLKAIESAN